MQTVFKRTSTIKKKKTHYCPGCGHGIAHRLIAEVMDELELRDRAIGIAPVGCSVLAYEYIDVDMVEVPHGRAPAVATGMKRVRPDNIIFSYQGDGDLASIGAGEILHAAHRGENITVLFINNAVYGMTGGQMAPTTLTDQVTQTTPLGRKTGTEGYPLNVSEMLATMPGVAHIERCSLHNTKEILKTKRALKHVFELQENKVEGLTMVEILSPCPTYWRKSAPDSMKWIEEVMTKQFPLGKLKEAKVPAAC